MKSIVLIGAIALVVFCCWLDVSQAQSTANATSASATGGNSKIVTVSNLTYTAVRRIRVGTTTTSSTSSRSSRSSNRKLRAKRNKAMRSTASRRQNSRRVRG